MELAVEGSYLGPIFFYDLVFWLVRELWNWFRDIKLSHLSLTFNRYNTSQIRYIPSQHSP